MVLIGVATLSYCHKNLLADYRGKLTTKNSPYFGLLYVSTSTLMEVEVWAYPWTSLVAEFGATLYCFQKCLIFWIFTNLSNVWSRHGTCHRLYTDMTSELFNPKKQKSQQTSFCNKTALTIFSHKHSELININKHSE